MLQKCYAPYAQKGAVDDQVDNSIADTERSDCNDSNRGGAHAPQARCIEGDCSPHSDVASMSLALQRLEAE